MIIVQLLGGLGNQLFQYAIGRRIAYENDTILKLDLTGFQNYNIRKYKLGSLNIIENIATLEEIVLLKGSGDPCVFGKVKSLVKKFKPYYKQSIIKERFFQFDPNMLLVKDNAYLRGYWQSEKYFKHIEDIIRQEFTLRAKPDKINSQLGSDIVSRNSVSIHVRRGDYASNSRINKIHGTCNLDYYFESINKIAEVVEEPTFYVFSDDPPWVHKNLKIPYPTVFVTHNGPEKDYEDLRLMSLCKHHIIANSSFSWWGAWLCSNPDKMVFAPKKWFNTPDLDTRDLIPESWHRI